MTAWLPVGLAAAAAAVAARPRGDGGRRLAALAPQERWDVARAPALAAALVVVGCLVALGAVAAGLAAAGALVLRRGVRSRRRQAAQERERARALDALSMLAADLRAGRSAAEAFAAAAAIACGESAVALASAAAAAGLGGDVGSALLAERSAVASTLRALAACWRVCSDAGGGLADAVERLEEGIRAAEAQRQAVAAELAGPQATAQLLAVLPLGGVALAAALGAHPLDLLLGTPVGVACLLLGLALDGAGVLWTRRLTAQAVQ